MTVVRAQVRLPYSTGKPEDVATNTWWFSHPTDTLALMAPDIVEALTAFYVGIDQHLSHVINEAANQVLLYDILAPEPRVPIVGAMAGLSISDAQSSLPLEVASVLSFRAVPPSTPSAMTGATPSRRSRR